MTENEIKLANITEKDKILHIGCGPFPATSIVLAKKTRAKITGIDINKKSVNQAIYFVSKYSLSNQIEIKHADANHFSVENFDLILISQGIKPHEEILKYISQKIKQNTRVIYRTICNMNGNICQNDMFLNDIFKIVQIEYNKKNGLLVSILLKKKEHLT
jgi:precorrin-6B methylase 2